MAKKSHSENSFNKLMNLSNSSFYNFNLTLEYVYILNSVLQTVELCDMYRRQTY